MAAKGKIINLDRAIFKIDLLTKSMPLALGKELYQEAEGIMTVSKDQYVPVDLGTLKSSGSVDLPVITSKGASVTMGYGNAAASYALYVHEDLTVGHKVGSAKYLEIPYKAALTGMAKRIADKLVTVVKRLT